MKLGLITDIHEHVEHLRSALDQLQREQVDQIVMLGDILEMGERIQETCELLANAQAIGVWGTRCLTPTPSSWCQEKLDDATSGVVAYKPFAEITITA